MSKKFKISVIVPVYNVEDYLAETIDSIIAQTIGFRDNIELILVNDGSPDDSERICREYEDAYPDNIIYIKQKNSGVSAARNTGLDKVSGEYISFPDSDDKLEPDYFQHMLAGLARNSKVPFASARVKLFGARRGYHISDYKFKETRLIDLNNEPGLSTSLAPTLVFRAEAVRSVRFDTEMTHNEDAKFIDTVLLSCGVYKYVVVREAVYMYRKRDEGSSASDTARIKPSFYSSTIRYIDFLSREAKELSNDGTIPKFIQFHALYHYRWRFTQRTKPEVISDTAWKEYKDAVLHGIRCLDDETIVIGTINLNLRQKMSLLYVKYNNDKRKIKEAINKNEKLRKVLLRDVRFTVNTINYRHSEGIIVEGSTSFCEASLFNLTLRAVLNGKGLNIESFDTISPMFDEDIHSDTFFRFVIPKDKYGELKIIFEGNDGSQLDIAYESTARVSMRQYDYRIIKGSILLLPKVDSITITTFKLHKIAKREVLFFLQNLLKNKYKTQKNIPKTLAIEAVRMAALVSIRLKPSRVWLFSDRSISGGDNSEVLFRYVSDQKDSDVKPIFAINKNTPAYKRLRRDGYNVVAFKSIRHLYLAIVSEVILPSHMDMMYLYPWFGVWQKYCGLVQYDIAHTQHGIVLNDISSYIGKRKKNASIFLSACIWEQQQLIKGNYGYTEDQLPVTGLPRYDELSDTSSGKRIIALHPTWRSWLAGPSKDGVRGYSESFKESDYFNFYNRFINDERVILALDRYDYILQYYIHPNHIANRTDFTISSDRVEFMDFPYDYSKIFSESKLFITDYSNTLFDFGYLRKPVLHTQFDADIFFDKQGAISKQLFSYKDEGFGPVSTTYESTVSEFILLLENDMKLDSRYRKRIDSFFTYDDTNNSRRAYESIKSYVVDNRVD